MKRIVTCSLLTLLLVTLNLAQADEAPPVPRGAFTEPTELVLRTAAETFELDDASQVVVDIWSIDASLSLIQS